MLPLAQSLEREKLRLYWSLEELSNVQIRQRLWNLFSDMREYIQQGNGLAYYGVAEEKNPVKRASMVGTWLLDDNFLYPNLGVRILDVPLADVTRYGAEGSFIRQLSQAWPSGYSVEMGSDLNAVRPDSECWMKSLVRQWLGLPRWYFRLIAH